MGYNKAKAELAWKQEWEKKEKELNKAGWNKDRIQELKEFEWHQFNSDRRFYDHTVCWDNNLLEEVAAHPADKSIKTIDEMFDAIEDEYVYRELEKEPIEL